jgi:ParB-like chromosome segregation protein Spo0J
MSATSQSSRDPLGDGPPERLRLEFWPLDRLVPSARNARTHSAAQIAEIAGSIRAFGFTNPILVGEDSCDPAGCKHW